MIDLRSDTVTRPGPAMRAAMASAEVGDDVYGEDPTVCALEELVAERLGHEAALFVSSGTMGNQLGLLLGCKPGDDVIVGEGAHCVLYESGAASAIAGVQTSVAGRGGSFSADELEAAIHPAEAYYMPRTRLVAIENTHNRGGGLVWPLDQLRSVIERARARSLGLHLDGARLWNASIALGVAPASLARGFDTVSVCLSKGLGAPVGSVLCASRDRIVEARRLRKMLGGAMRQSGILAAAGLYALEHHVERLAEDHDHARRLATALGREREYLIDPERVQTNIVIADLRSLDAAALVTKAKSQGVLVSAFGPRRVRLVTHLDVDRAAIDRAGEILCRAVA